MKLKGKEKRLISRKYVLLSLLCIVLFGALLAPALNHCFEIAGISSLANISVSILLFVLLCIFFWLPLMIPTNQIMEMDEDTLSIMPTCSILKKFQIVWYVLISDNPKPFYRVLHLQDIEKITFTFDARWGSYAYQRFSFMLKIHLPQETLTLYLNPQQNGPILPSGYGNPFAANYSKEDMVNLIEHFQAFGVTVNDPYHLVNAMKDESVVLYDYLVSLKKNIIF